MTRKRITENNTIQEEIHHPWGNCTACLQPCVKAMALLGEIKEELGDLLTKSKALKKGAYHGT